MLRETFAYGGGARDPFGSLINTKSAGPELIDLQLVGIYQDMRSSANSVAVLREKQSGKRHKLRTGDQIGRLRVAQIRNEGRRVHRGRFRIRAPGNSLAPQAGGFDPMTRLYRALMAAALVMGTAPAARAAAPPAGELTAVSIVAAPGRVDFVLQVTGNVQVNDFFLSDPDRLVLDLVGAKLGTSQIKLYDGVNRGGITNVRYAQYKPGTVRIVLDLESAKPYKVEQNGGEIRVSFGSSANFAGWSSNGPAGTRVVKAAAAEGSRRRDRQRGRRGSAGAVCLAVRPGSERDTDHPDGGHAEQRGAADHGDLGSREHRRRGGRVRRLQRSHDHPGQVDHR